MYARVFFMKTVNSCKDVSIRMNSAVDGQIYSVCIMYAVACTMQSKHKQTNFKHSRQKSYGLHAFSVGITILNQRII